MSESSEDKSKRKYVALLTGNEWRHQYSVFYDDPTQSVRLLSDMVRFKQSLRRKVADQPFLIRIQTLNKAGQPLQAYLTMFTTKRVEGLKDVISKLFASPVNVAGRTLQQAKIDSIADAICTQRPQDLSKVFGKTGVNRWSVLNKPLLIGKVTEQDQA